MPETMEKAVDRHAPAGHRIFMQFPWDTPRERAYALAAKLARTENLILIPGHFEYQFHGAPVYRPRGWMVFRA